jgi:RNA polymerase sigma-70 factor (ECF subfamily)
MGSDNPPVNRLSDSWTIDAQVQPSRKDRSSQPGDAERLIQIFEDRSRTLLHFLKRINFNRPNIAEDLLQETMLKVWQHIDEAPIDDDHIRSWLFTIARNVSVDEARKRRRRPEESESEHAIANRSGSPDPMEIVIATHAMLEAYKNLTPERRRALDEVYVNRRSAEEVANLLAVPEGTVRSRAFYAMQSLRSAVLSK